MLENQIQKNLITREALRPDEIHVFDRYCNGELTRELDAAKRAHGYGTLSTGERLGPFGPTAGRY